MKITDRVQGKTFLTDSGRTCLKKDRINAFTVKHTSHQYLVTVTEIDVFMHCGTVFTINRESVNEFLDWVGELNG